MTADEVWWLQQMLWQWSSTHGKWYYQLMTIQAINTWWQLVKIYASWQMPKSGNFWRKHFWTENKAAKFWESPPHVALATHGCARGRMEIKFPLCARKHIFYLLYLQRGEKVEPQWQKTRHGGKTGFVCSSRRSTFCSQCTAHSSQSQLKPTRQLLSVRLPLE